MFLMDEKKWLFALALFSIALRLFFLSDLPNGIDEREVFAWIGNAERSLVEPYPPGFNFFVKTIFLATQSVFWTRFALALFSSFSILFVFLVARQLFDSKTGLWAAAFLAVSPAFVVYSTHLRAYGLLMAIFLIATFFFLNLLGQRPRKIDQAGLLVFYALGFWFHYYAFLFVLVHGLILLVQRPSRGKAVQWGIPVFLSLLLALPLVPLLLLQLGQVQGNATGYFSSPFSPQGILSIGATFLFLFIPLSKGFLLSSIPIALFAAAFFALIIGVFAFSQWNVLASKDRRLFFLVFGMFFFLVLGFLAQKTHFWPRYVVPSLPFWLLALAYGVARQRFVSTRLLGCALVIGFLVVDLFLFLLFSSNRFHLVYY